METTYNNQEYSLKGTVVNGDNKILITSKKTALKASVASSSEKVVWIINTFGGNHPITQNDFLFIHEILIKFKYYWKQLKQ